MLTGHDHICFVWPFVIFANIIVTHNLHKNCNFIYFYLTALTQGLKIFMEKQERMTERP